MKEGGSKIKRYAWCLKCSRMYLVHFLNKGNHWCDMNRDDVPRRILRWIPEKKTIAEWLAEEK